MATVANWPMWIVWPALIALLCAAGYWLAYGEREATAAEEDGPDQYCA